MKSVRESGRLPENLSLFFSLARIPLHHDEVNGHGRDHKVLDRRYSCVSRDRSWIRFKPNLQVSNSIFLTLRRLISLFLSSDQTVPDWIVPTKSVIAVSTVALMTRLTFTRFSLVTWDLQWLTTHYNECPQKSCLANCTTRTRRRLRRC